jgi:hypothetical protein
LIHHPHKYIRDGIFHHQKGRKRPLQIATANRGLIGLKTSEIIVENIYLKLPPAAPLLGGSKN